MACLSASGFLESEGVVQEKIKKKKKKHKGTPQSPNQILAFNTSKFLKLDEHKTEMRRCFSGDSSRVLSKCHSLPINSIRKAVTEGSRNLQNSIKYATSSSPDTVHMLSRVDSLPLKSALRGSSVELGIGPRPKLHVQWDQSVWEPPCSTISHTVTKNHPKKKGLKPDCCGKSSSADPCIEQYCGEAHGEN